MKKIMMLLTSLLLAAMVLVPVKASAEERQSTVTNIGKTTVGFYVLDELDEVHPEVEADALYDYMDFPDKKPSSVILVYGEDNGVAYISTSGDAIKVFTDAKIQELGRELRPYLNSRDYSGAYSVLTISVKNATKYPLKSYIFISALVSLIVAFIGTATLKGQLKSVAPKNEAYDYVKPGSMRVHVQRDMFLYRKVEREKKPENNSSSTTHTSEAGVKHGGGRI